MKYKKAIKYFRSAPNNSVFIFLFHGIINKNSNLNSVINYNNKHLLASDFKQFLLKISKISDPVSMDEVYKITKNKKKLKRKKFAITFDDGFENNLSIASPILKNLNIPYTVYITTKFVDKNLMSWVDNIDYATDKTKKKNININELNKSFSLKSRGEKILFLNKVRSFVKFNKNLDPYKFSKKLCTNLGISDFPVNNVIYKKLNWMQVKKLSKTNLCTIGGHSHSHKILGYLSDSELKKEVSKSCKLIKKNLGFKVVHYSYPEGFKKSFSSKVISELRKENIKCCPTALTGFNNEKSNPFLLKRIGID